MKKESIKALSFPLKCLIIEVNSIVCELNLKFFLARNLLQFSHDIYACFLYNVNHMRSKCFKKRVIRSNLLYRSLLRVSVVII